MTVNATRTITEERYDNNSASIDVDIPPVAAMYGRVSRSHLRYGARMQVVDLPGEIVHAREQVTVGVGRTVASAPERGPDTACCTGRNRARLPAWPRMTTCRKGRRRPGQIRPALPVAATMFRPAPAPATRRPVVRYRCSSPPLQTGNVAMSYWKQACRSRSRSRQGCNKPAPGRPHRHRGRNRLIAGTTALRAQGELLLRASQDRAGSPSSQQNPTPPQGWHTFLEVFLPPAFA